MIRPTQFVLILAATIGALLGITESASAQIASVTITAVRNGDTATAQIAVNAKFKKPSGEVVSGDFTFGDVSVAMGTNAPPKPATQDGFRYTITKLEWTGDDTIEVTAQVRSLYGTVESTGKTKV